MVWDQKSARLVELVYDIVDSDHGWAPTLNACRKELDSQGIHLFVRDQSSGQFIEECYLGGDYGEKLQSEFERLLPTDPAWPIAAAQPGAIINDVDHYSEKFFENTPMYNEVLRNVDCHYRVTSVLPIKQGWAGGFALTRSKESRAFGNEQVERLELLLPHIVRALRLQRRLRQVEREADNVVAALDRLPTAALIVKDTCEIVCCNAQAEQMLAAEDCLRVHRKKLSAVRSSEANALRKAVADAIALADGAIETPIAPPQVVSISRDAKLPLDVLAVPLRPRYRLRQNTDRQSRVLVLIYDPESRPRINPLLIERLIGLTHTEAHIAARLAEGKSSREIAEERKCSRSTVRTHVKRILRKTRTNRQAELVQLILTSPAISFEG